MTALRLIALNFFALALLEALLVFAEDPETIARAKDEKGLFWYSSTASDDARQLISAFNKKYPFIEIRHVRGGTEQVLRRIDTEARAGVLQADVIDVNGLYGGVLLERGYWIPYFSPETRSYPPELKDPKGRWSSIFLLTLVPSLNSRLVALDARPKSWEDLLHPSWKGKLGIVDTGVLFYAGIKSYMGEKNGEQYLHRLRANNPIIVNGFTLAVNQLAAGEYPVLATTYGHRVEQLIARGAPIDWVRSDAVFVMPQIIGLVGRGKAPHAAKLWMDFLISQEGQRVFRDLRRIPAHPKVDPIPSRLTRGVKLHYVGVTERADSYNHFMKSFREIFR
ncbi:MAG: extracellular solute-binding protein [Deltaproteobacteria bacterium]|nr:extracellular solute-binding protein [Deltaproteobacteria bacterium]